MERPNRVAIPVSGEFQIDLDLSDTHPREAEHKIPIQREESR
jgi:hypothetical protein